MLPHHSKMVAGSIQFLEGRKTAQEAHKILQTTNLVQITGRQHHGSSQG